MSKLAAPTEVLIVFYCRSGSAERLALAAAVGAVQARTNIRLRRLSDINPKGEGEDFARMRKEYVLPTEADVLRADALVFIAPAIIASSAHEWTEFIELLRRCGSEGRLAGKITMVLGETEAARESLSSMILPLGFTTLPSSPHDATAAGRRVGAAANAIKQAQY